MRAEEFRNLGPDELDARERDLREQVFRLRFQIALGQTDGVKKYRATKKDLARLLTVRQQQPAKEEA